MSQVQGPGGGHSWFSSLGKKISQAWSKVSQAVGRVFSSIPPKSGNETTSLLSPEKMGKEDWHYEYARKEVEALEQELKAPLKPSEREELIDRIATNALKKQQKQEKWKEAYAQAKAQVEDLVQQGGELYHLPEEHKEALIQLIAIHNRLGGKPPTEDIHEPMLVGKTGEVMTLDIKAGETTAVITLPYGEILQEGRLGRVLKPLILAPRPGQAPIICKMGLSKEEKVAKAKEVAELEQEIAQLEQQEGVDSSIIKSKRQLLAELKEDLKDLNIQSAKQATSLKKAQIVIKTLYRGRGGKQVPGIPPHAFMQGKSEGQETTVSSPLLYATYYNQGSLADAMKKGSFPQDLLTQYDMMLQLAEGMAYAHENSVFLRDIKLENLLWNDEGEVAFTDLERSICTSEEALQENDGELLRAGSKGYFLPEEFTKAKREDQKIQRLLHEHIPHWERQIEEDKKELAKTPKGKKPDTSMGIALQQETNLVRGYRQELAATLLTFNELNAQMDTYNFCIVLAEMFLGRRLVTLGELELTKKEIEEALQKKGVDAKVINIIMRGMGDNVKVRPTEKEIVEALRAAKQALKGRAS